MYIKGSLAHLKMSLTDQVSDLLLSHQFVPLSGPNLYKSIALVNIKKVLQTICNSNIDISKLNLNILTM